MTGYADNGVSPSESAGANRHAGISVAGELVLFILICITCLCLTVIGNMLVFDIHRQHAYVLNSKS